MATELEQEFYDTFGIEPKWKDKRVKNSKTYYTKEQADYLRTTTKNRNIQLCYPEITDRKLLKMICILNETACEVLASENIEDLKNEILETCIKVYNTPILTSDGDEYDNYAIYDKIQQLFKGT